MTIDGGERELVDVRVIGLPLRLFAKGAEHGEELRREFTLMAMRPPDESSHPVPKRLVQLIAELNGRYGSFTAGPDAAREEAMATGGDAIDLVYQVPPHAATAARELAALLAEADEFCRDGDHLLTLATPPELVRLRDWYLGEFIRQIEHGAEPTPWPEFDRAERDAS